jgi:hypothetical protein
MNDTHAARVADLRARAARYYRPDGRSRDTYDTAADYVAIIVARRATIGAGATENAADAVELYTASWRAVAWAEGEDWSRALQCANAYRRQAYRATGAR